MGLHRRSFLAMLASAGLGLPTGAGASSALAPEDVLQQWYGLMLELVRHTATYSPPVASRAFGYIGVAAYEAAVAFDASLLSLAGQLPGLAPLPAVKGRVNGAIVVHGALQAAAGFFFGNTGPTGQRAIQGLTRKLDANLLAGGKREVRVRSLALGQQISAHIIAWSQSDGGAEVANLGFPENYELKPGKREWVPTTAIRLQQKPLLPSWGENRPFAMPAGSTCVLPPPLDYSEDPSSEFYGQALEVRDVVNNLTPEQKLIARFWSDDPMLSFTPPGHWLYITLDILKSRGASLADHVDILSRLGIAMADAFIGCWHQKFAHNLLRPVTYIKRVIDPAWEPLLITPPFPEYPSGHSTQSGAAEVVLTQFFGDGFAFEDKTHVREKLPVRRFSSFKAAAEEAAMSRLYGGIHFRNGNVQGLVQGRCIGAYANALKTRRTA